MQRFYSDMDTVTARICLCWNVAPAQMDRTFLSRTGNAFSKHVHISDRTKILVIYFEETEARDNFAGHDQKQFRRPSGGSATTAQYTLRLHITTGTSLCRVEVPLLNKYTSRREYNSWSQNSRRPDTKNDCVGEDQQRFSQSTHTHPYHE
jgi:hypothetical protein